MALPPGRILALDYGKKRIGLAISDELGITAQGLPTLERTNIREDLARLAALVEERAVTSIVIGDPLHMSGRESRGSHSARAFGERLHKRTGAPISYWDERLTSAEANRLLRVGGASIEQRARAVDRLSAQLLLENYLAAADVTGEAPCEL